MGFFLKEEGAGGVDELDEEGVLWVSTDELTIAEDDDRFTLRPSTIIDVSALTVNGQIEFRVLSSDDHSGDAAGRITLTTDGQWVDGPPQFTTGADAYILVIREGENLFSWVTLYGEAIPGPAGSVGPQGVPGPQGVSGQDGAQGEEGPQGPQGIQGPQGVQGPAGTGDGTGGEQGPQGPEGPQGIQGIQGPAGAQGVAGTPGEDGPLGPEGPEGPQGGQGPQGSQGTPGVTGAAGPVGPQGVPGFSISNFPSRNPDDFVVNSANTESSAGNIINPARWSLENEYVQAIGTTSGANGLHPLPRRILNPGRVYKIKVRVEAAPGFSGSINSVTYGWDAFDTRSGLTLTTRSFDFDETDGVLDLDFYFTTDPSRVQEVEDLHAPGFSSIDVYVPGLEDLLLWRSGVTTFEGCRIYSFEAEDITALLDFPLVGPEGPQGIQGPQGEPGVQGVDGQNGSQGLPGSPGLDGQSSLIVEFTEDLENIPSQDTLVFAEHSRLAGDGGGGLFRWETDDVSGLVSLDGRGAVAVPVSGQDGSSGAWVRVDYHTGEINLGWWGLVPDLNANITGLLNDAIELASGTQSAVVRIPSRKGTYRMRGQVRMMSGVTIIADEGCVFNCLDTNESSVISFEGSVEPLVNISSPINRSDRVLNVSSPQDWGPGDLVRLVSQRDSLSPDAGDFQLGDGTTSINAAYFQEFHLIQSRNSGTSYGTGAGVVFPNYRPDDSQETDPDALPSAYVQKINPIKDSHWIGGTFIRTDGVQFIVATLCYKCTVQDVTVDRGAALGHAMRWDLSYQCESLRFRVLGDAALDWDYDILHGRMNRLILRGSQDCGFRECEVNYSAQPVDFSFGLDDTAFCNVRPYCRDSIFQNNYEGATSHAGSYREEWTGNTFTDCFRGGIVARGLQPLIENNTMTSTTEFEDGSTGLRLSRGIALINGHTRGAVVRNNSISGFRAGVEFVDGADAAERFTRIDAVIEGNNISDCYYGLRPIFSVIGAISDLRGIIYRNNFHTRIGKAVVSLPRYSAGVTVENNTLTGRFLAPGFVSFVEAVDGDCPGLTFRGNLWMRGAFDNSTQTRYLLFLNRINNSSAFPGSTWANQTVVENNRVLFDDGVQTIIDNTTYTQ